MRGVSMIDDMGKTIKAILYDRVTSPLFGAFILSWCGWNWRLILLFLTGSSTTVIQKFEYVDSQIYPNIDAVFIRGFLLPAATTVFFIYIYPWFARKVYGYSREQQNKLKNIQLEKDGETPLTKEEAKKVTNQALLSELRYQEEREKRESRIQDLENLVMTLQAANKNSLVNEPAGEEELPTSASKPKRNKLTRSYSDEVMNGMFAVLNVIDSLASGGSITKDDFMRGVEHDDMLSGLKTTFVLHCLDNLTEGKYVTSSGQYLAVQAKGRTALVNKSFDE